MSYLYWCSGLVAGLVTADIVANDGGLLTLLALGFISFGSVAILERFVS